MEQNLEITSEVNPSNDIFSKGKPLPKDKIQYFDTEDELSAKIKGDNFTVYEHMYMRPSFKNQYEIDKYSSVPRITDRCLFDGNYVKQYWHIQQNNNYCEFCYYNGCMDYSKVSDRSVLLKMNICSCTKHGQKETPNIEKNWCGNCQCPLPINQYYLENVCKNCNVIGLHHEEHLYCTSCVPENVCYCGKEINQDTMEIDSTPIYSGCPGRNQLSKQKMYSVGNTPISDLTYCQHCYEQGCWGKYEREYLDGKIVLPETQHNHMRMVPIVLKEISVKTVDGKDEKMYAMVPDFPEEKEEKKDESKEIQKSKDESKPKIPIINTINQKIEVEYNSNFNDPIMTYGNTCDCYYHRNDKPSPKFVNNWTDKELKYCGHCTEDRKGQRNRECRNCKYFACTISTEYYCHFCAKELNICPCGNKLYTYDYEDHPEIKVARIHTSMGYLLGRSEIMETELILAFPDYIGLYLDSKEKPNKPTTAFEAIMGHKHEVNMEEVKKYVEKLRDIERSFSIEKSKYGIRYPEVESRYVIYDDCTEEVTHGFQFLDEINKDKKIILEIRKVLLDPQTEVEFWIFTNDERYKYLRTIMTDGNAFVLNKIIGAVSSNRDYVNYGMYESHIHIKIVKEKIKSNEKNIADLIKSEEYIPDEVTYKENLPVPEQYLDYLQSIISVVQEKNIPKTTFLNDIPLYFIKDSGSISEDVIKRMIDNSKYISIKYYGGKYYFKPREIVSMYQAILDYISSLGIETNEQGKYFHEKSELINNDIIRTKTINLNMPYPTDKGLLKIKDVDECLLKKCKELFSDRSDKEIEKIFDVFNKQFLEKSYYDGINKPFSNKEDRELFYMFLPLLPDFTEQDIATNRDFDITIRNKSNLLYNMEDVLRKIIMYCSKNMFSANYNFILYSSCAAIMHGAGVWIRLLKYNDAIIQLSFNEQDGEKFKNNLSNIILIFNHIGMKHDILLQCRKCKGYAVERSVDYQTKKETLGEPYLAKYNHSKFCDCSDELSCDELREIENKRIEIEERKQCAEWGWDYDKMSSPDLEVRKLYAEELKKKHEKECQESGEEYCFCSKCSLDKNGKKIAKDEDKNEDEDKEVVKNE